MSLLDSVIGALANSQPGVQPPAPGATQGVPGSVLLSTVIAMLASSNTSLLYSPALVRVLTKLSFYLKLFSKISLNVVFIYVSFNVGS